MKHFSKEEVIKLLKEELIKLDILPEGTMVYYCGPNNEAIPGWAPCNQQSHNHKIMVKVSRT